MIVPETDRVLITGAAGAIGTALRTACAAMAPSAADGFPPGADLAGNEEMVVTDIADRASSKR